MTENDLLIFQNFAELWSRVTGEACGQQPAGDWRREVLQQLYDAAAGYESMGRCARGRVRQKLLCMQQETESMIRHLQAGLYLESNDTFIPVKRRTFCKLCASDLQKLWKIAISLSELRKTGNRDKSGDAAADLSAVQALGAGHAAALQEILACIL